MTLLGKAIKKAVGDQYPKASGSDAEESLAWQIEHCSDLPKPKRQVRLVAGRKFSVDFLWERESIVVEVNGGLWMSGLGSHGGGAHSRPLNILRDWEKSNLVQKTGYTFYQFSTDQVKNGEALQFIKELF